MGRKRYKLERALVPKVSLRGDLYMLTGMGACMCNVEYGSRKNMLARLAEIVRTGEWISVSAWKLVVGYQKRTHRIKV